MYISEFINNELAFISILKDDKNIVFKFSNDSKEMKNLFNFLDENKDEKIITLNKSRILYGLIQNRTAIEKLMFIEFNEYQSLVSIWNNKKDGIINENHIPMSNIVGEQLNLKTLMLNQDIKKMDTNTENAITKLIYEQYKSEIELRGIIAQEYKIPAYTTKYELIQGIFEKRVKKGEERGKDFKLSEVLIDKKYPKLLEPIIKKIENISVTNDDITDLINDSVMIKSTEVKIGMGGLHGHLKGFFDSDMDNVILSIDVSSYYPSIIVNNNLIPNNLKGFLDEYKKLYNKKMEEDSRYKHIINYIYGLSNNKNSIFYDPKFATTITLNGQLMMLKLLNTIQANVDTFVPLVVNTDGFYCIVSRNESKKLLDITDNWCKVYNLKTTTEYLRKLIIQNGNNLIKIGEVDEYENKISVKGKSLASFEGKGIFNTNLLGNNPLKQKVMKENIIILLTSYLLELKPIDETMDKLLEITR